MGGRGFQNISNSIAIPVTYKITDYNGKAIQGSLYEQELQKRSKTYLG